MSKRTPKNPKNWHNTPVVLCWHENFLESNKRQRIPFRPLRWDVRYRKPSCLLWEAPVCEKHISEPATNMTNFLPWHIDAAPWYHAKFHEFHADFGFTRILKPDISMFCRQSTVPWCLKFIPISCMGPQHAPKDKDLIFQPIYMHWSMCM